MKNALFTLLSLSYQLAAIATFGYLTFFDGYAYNWYNWIIALPINGMMASLWPIYWAFIRPSVHFILN